MNSAIALTPLQLKSSLNILKQSPEAQIDVATIVSKIYLDRSLLSLTSTK